MKNRFIFTISVVATVLSFSSCDPGRDITKRINNLTNENFTLYYKTNYIDTTIAIKANTETIFDAGIYIGSGKGYTSCLQDVDSLNITPNDSNITLLKEIHLDKNWEFTNDNKRQYGNSKITCGFEITNNDIQ